MKKIRKNATQLNAVCCFYHNFLTHNNEWGWSMDKALEWLEENSTKWFYSRNMAVYNAKGVLVYDYVYQFLFKGFYLEFTYYPRLGLYMYDSSNPDIGRVLLLEDTILQNITNQDLTIGDYPLYNPQ